ncbi:reverse transcriptase domain-containing protein [Tanacetum coccineum]
MPPTMRTRSVGQLATESLRRGTGERVGRGGKGRRPREGNDERVKDLNGPGNDQGMGVNRGVEGVNGNVEGANGNVEGANRGAPDFSTIIAQQLQNLLPAMLAQVSNRGNVGNQNGNVVNENVQENIGNVIVNGNRVGCSYKEFLACNPKEYDCKGGAVVLTRWIEKMESVHDMSGCSIDQKVKYTAGLFVGKALTWWNSQIRTLSREVVNYAMVGAGHAAYTDRFHELDRMVAATEPNTIQKAVQISGALTDEAIRNGSIKKVKDRSGRDDNKKTTTGNVFTTTINPDCRGVPRNVNPVNARNPTVRACYECGSTNHVKSACPRLNRAQQPEGNRPNQAAANNGGQGRGVSLKISSQTRMLVSREIVDQAWVKHSKDHFRAPTAKDMEILIKTCLMPLTLKTQNDSFAFVHELKKEMHDDLKKSSFAKPYDVNAPGPSRKSPKHVSFQSPRESVGSNDMVHNYYLEEAKKKAQLQKDKP